VDDEEEAELELYLLRHAHAGNPAEWNGDDAARPLSPKGRRQARALGKFLAERGFGPDSIVSSPKVRARHTADIVADAIGIAVAVDERLAGPLDLDVLGAVIAAAGGDQIVLVGHDPDFSDLLATLCGAADMPMRKGAVARIDLALPLEPGVGTLRWLLPPELLIERG
jgi:phosphohistidine phosphatase SixA